MPNDGGSKMLKRFLKSEEGQALTEYGLILALIAVVCIAALTLTGTSVSGVLNNIAASV